MNRTWGTVLRATDPKESATMTNGRSMHWMLIKAMFNFLKKKCLMYNFQILNAKEQVMKNDEFTYHFNEFWPEL